MQATSAAVLTWVTQKSRDLIDTGKYLKLKVEKTMNSRQLAYIASLLI
jgi:hypothetical protein